MIWTQQSEVSMVECRELVLAEPFEQREHAGVDYAQRLVVVLGLEIPAAREVSGGCGLEPVGAGEQVIEERDPGIDTQPLMAPVVELGEYEDRYDEILVGFAQQLRAAGVIWVGCIEGGEQRTGVEHQRHLRGRMRNRLRRDLRGRKAVGRSRDPEAGTASGVQGPGLLVDRFREHRGQGHSAPVGLGFEGVER